MMKYRLQVLDPWNWKDTCYDSPRMFRAQLRRYLGKGACIATGGVKYDIENDMYVVSIQKNGADGREVRLHTPGYQCVYVDGPSHVEMYFQNRGYAFRWKVMDLPGYAEDIAVIRDAIRRMERIMEQDRSSRRYAWGYPGLKGIKDYFDHYKW